MVQELRQKAHLSREQVRVVHQINPLMAQVRLQIRQKLVQARHQKQVPGRGLRTDLQVLERELRTNLPMEREQHQMLVPGQLRELRIDRLLLVRGKELRRGHLLLVRGRELRINHQWLAVWRHMRMPVLPQKLVPRMHLAPVLDFQMLELQQELQTFPVLGQVLQSHQSQWQALEPLQSHLPPVPQGHQTDRQRERVLELQNH